MNDDWVTLCGVECTTNVLSGVDSEGSLFVNIDLESVVHITDKITTAVSSGLGVSCMDLYDSRTTHHISPSHKVFENYASTPSKSLNAMNNRRFIAVGKGDMVIEVPNGICLSMDGQGQG